MRKNLLVMLIFLSHVAFAQQGIQVKGKITNTKGEPLAGATIYVSPTNKTLLSDDAGNYIVFVLESIKQIAIKVSYTGYATEEKTVDINAGSASNTDFQLKSDVLSLTDVVITANASSRNKITSSVSVSTVRQEDIQKSAPRTTAEIFRNIPGIKAEASGGDGNTNITVRGVPISAGGSKYLQLQEDGLPVLQFGDIAFATADIFLRADNTLSRIEAIRGGSASVLATNSPAGIINFVSKTGTVKGGNIALTSGLDYGNYRADFNYGMPVGNNYSFNVGGFYRIGEGPRTAGFNANNGGQIKMNFTKKFDKGYIRLYAKYLNDKAAAYMPMPIQVSGTNSNPVYSSLPGFDAKYGAMQSKYLLQDIGTGVNGEVHNTNVKDGMHPITKSIGAEFSFDLGDGVKIEDRFKYANNSGGFIAPFPASIGTTASMLATIATATGWDLKGASVSYADGKNYSGSNAMIMHMFNTSLNNFNNLVNDLKLKKSFKNSDLTLGLYKANQNIDMSWIWTSYLTDISGNGLHPLIIKNASGTIMNPGTSNAFAYGTPVWGNLRRSYDTKYNIWAPYLNATINLSNRWNVDGGIRMDVGKVTGSYAGGSISAKDMNGDNVTSPNETSVESINYAAAKPVNYKYSYASYSIGTNYKITANQAVFARYSSGATTKADRILFTDNILADGSVKGIKDQIDQAELGYKANYKNLGLFLTAFYAKVNEMGGYEATTQKIIENHYKSLGLEIEFAARLSKSFDMRGGATFTNAKITEGSNKGNKPRRQSPFIYNIMPTYNAGKFSAGLSAIGTTWSYAQDNNQLKFKGYILLNPFVSYKIMKQLNLSLNANNVFNSLGITEAEEGSITENTTNIIRARSVTGRTISATLSFTF